MTKSEAIELVEHLEIFIISLIRGEIDSSVEQAVHEMHRRAELIDFIVMVTSNSRKKND